MKTKEKSSEKRKPNFLESVFMDPDKCNICGGVIQSEDAWLKMNALQTYSRESGRVPCVLQVHWHARCIHGKYVH